MLKLSAATCLLVLCSTAGTLTAHGAENAGAEARPAPAVSEQATTSPAEKDAATEAAPQLALPAADPAPLPPPAPLLQADEAAQPETVRFPVPRSLGPVFNIPARQRGPEGIPQMLPGVWHVTLCLETGNVAARHCWFRYQNVHTGEVHTLSRFIKGGGWWVDQNDNWISAPAEVAGLVWDNDLKREVEIQQGRVHMLNVIRTNPCIYRGWNNGYGHCGAMKNCATWCRDAWEFYTGEKARLLPLIHATGTLHGSLNRMHPGLVFPGRVVMLSR